MSPICGIITARYAEARRRHRGDLPRRTPVERACQWIRTLFLPMLIALAALPMTASRADAIEMWCADDPIVSVGGRLVDVQVQLPLDKLLTMRSTTLTVVVPSNVRGFVVLDDISAFPMRTTVSSTGPAWNGAGNLPVTIEVQVSSTVDFPVRVTAKPLVSLSAPLTALGTLLTPAWMSYGVANSILRMPVALGR